ncbi:unnamed protein product [Callosobruchus maculatus]|uniref:Kazal-like domain-containing protein n=1 Tax=Callosobruchus maculatus TaxID=64391 RepID=A0A653DKP8_CALMS|nr:unnamed protein product [Callosobruchus maculatus]
MIWLLMTFSGIVYLQNFQCYAHYFVRPTEISNIRAGKAVNQPLVRKPRQNIFQDGSSSNDDKRILFPNDDNEGSYRFQNTGTAFQDNGRVPWNNAGRFESANQNPRPRNHWFQNVGSGFRDENLFLNDGSQHHDHHHRHEVEWLQNEGTNVQSQNNGDFFVLRPTTSSPRTTPIPIPGSATRRSTCEDQCQATMQYNPVCGTNSVTYTNIEWYKCARRCGKVFGIRMYTACPRN